MDSFDVRSRLDALVAAAERFGTPLPDDVARHATFAAELDAHLTTPYEPAADLERAYATAGAGRASRIAETVERIAASAAMGQARPLVADALTRAATRHLRAAYAEATGPEVGRALGVAFDRSAEVFTTAWTALRARLGRNADPRDRAALVDRPDAVDVVAEHITASTAADDLDALAGLRLAFGGVQAWTEGFALARSAALIDWRDDLAAARKVPLSGYTGAPVGLDWGIPLDLGAVLRWADSTEHARRVEVLRKVHHVEVARANHYTWGAA